MVLNAHYGNLPKIRGWNATEWSILVEGALEVSLYQVVQKMDQGPVFLKRTVEVLREDDGESLRIKCQKAAKDLYLEFFAAPAHFSPLLHEESEGKNYYLMNSQLKRIMRKKIEVIGR